MIRNALACLCGCVFLLLFIPSLYLTAAIIGGIMPSSNTAQPVEADVERPYEIKLFMSFLHADIAIPIDDDVLKRFAFLDAANFPIHHSNLRYLVVGWGSEAFYTSAGDYSDITPSATFKAITGDLSVMHVVPSGEIEFDAKTTSLQLDKEGFENLLNFIQASFQKSADQQPIFMDGVTHGYGDVFYKGVGGFNIFHPCNMWVNTALKEADIKLGAWTPTTQSLKLSLDLWHHRQQKSRPLGGL